MLPAQTTRRLHWLLWVLLLWAGGIFARLVFLQVVQHDVLLAKAESQQQRVVEIEAMRGSILDRTGQPLAKTLEVDTVVLDPSMVADPDEAASLLAPTLGLDPADLRDGIADYKQRKKRFMYVKRKVSDKESVAVHALDLPYVFYETELKRYYPNNELAAHVLGSIGYTDATDMQHGNAGLELTFESDLAGQPGLARQFTDSHRNVYEAEMLEEPVPGSDLTLTIDPKVQYEAEARLKEAVLDSRAVSGSVVAVDPYTGDILAMANYPTFDPNSPPGGNDRSRNNLAITSPFEPGSVFKVITMAAGLELAGLNPQSLIDCGNGILRLPGRVIHDDHPEEVLTMTNVLAKSNNIGSVNIALKVGKQRLYEFQRQMGFGSRTGIELPGESGGILRPAKTWHPAAIGSLAIGHEIGVTSLQLALAGSVVANGGNLVKPRLVLSRQRPGQPVERFAQEPVKRVVRPETAIQLRQMMEAVVLSGTGSRAVLPGYTSGGKTGSAQWFDVSAGSYTHTYNASFMGFAPVTNPRIVIAVTLHRTKGGTQGYGGVRAAPVFREVAMSALRMLDVPKDLPDAEMPEVDPDEVLDDLPFIVEEPGSEFTEALGLIAANNKSAIAPAFDFSRPASGTGFRAVSSVTPPPVLDSNREQGRRPFLKNEDTLPKFPMDDLAMEASGELEVVEDATIVAGPRTPDFRGMTLQSVMRESAAAGLDVKIYGSGVARSQDPPPGAMLPQNGSVRVRFEQ